MRRAKISIIGAGNVGATTAHWCAAAELGDVVLLDIPATEGMPAGKALDLFQASPIVGFDCQLTGTTDWADTAGSDVVVVTAGIARKPGMSRDDLLSTNAKIVGDVAAEIRSSSPEATVIVAANPLDANGAADLSGDRLSAGPGDGAGRNSRHRSLPSLSGDGTRGQRRRHRGDSARRPRRYDGADSQLHQRRRYSGAPVDRCRAARCDRRANPQGGAEIVGLLKTGSGYFAPAAATAQMVEAVVRDKKRLIPCAAFCDREYGVGGHFVGVPVILGGGGIERVVELSLLPEDKAALDKTIEAVRDLVAAMDRLTA